MHLEYLESFLAVAKTQNFSLAADSLYISQSSVTKRIQHLETQLGYKLFERTTKTVTLTKLGELYYEYALKISALESAFDKDISTMISNQQQLTLGTIPSSSAYNIADCISAFIKETHTNCKIISSPSGALQTMLENGQCDFAFIKNVDTRFGFKSVPYINDHMVVVLPKHHPLATRQALKITDLNHENFLLQPVGSRPYQLCLALFQQAGFTPSIVSTDSQIDNLVDFVGQGIGVSLLMHKIVTPNQNVVIVPIVPTVNATISLCYRDFTPNNLQVRFMNFFTANKEKFATK